MSIQNLAGQTLGQYELRELLGEGGMGAVYRAFQRTLEREVAIKVLPASLAAQTGYIERFTREARTAAALEHQNIVPVYDYGTQGSISYVVMRLLTGGTLADRLTHSVEENRPLPSLQEISDITRQLASALDYAHSQGVIHRDIKANNVMFDRQGTPFIVDFGIAKLLNATSALTGTGVAMGTPSYMAPEQWQGKDIGPASDQYALAVLVYVMLTGKMPFEADSPYQLMHKHMFDDPTPIHDYRADLPEALQKIFDRAFQKEPKNRFPTTTDFAKAIEEAVRVSPKQEPSGFFVTPLPVRKFNVPLQPTPPNMDGPTVTPTGSKIPDAIQATVADMTTGGSPPTATPPPSTGMPSTSPSSNKRLPLAILSGAAALVILIILAAVVLSNGDDGGNGGSGNNTQETSDPLIMAQGILTATAQTVATNSANSTITAQAVAAQATEEPTAEPTEAGISASPSPTATATSLSSPTVTRTNTPNAVQTLEARATRDSERTATAEGNGQGVEAPTSTPSPTSTRTARPSATTRSTTASSLTATSTQSVNASVTPTATFTRQSTTALTATSTPTATPSSSPSPTQTSTATDEMTATSDVNATSTRQAATQNAVQTLSVRATADANKTQTARATAGAGPTQTAQAIAAIQIAETNREVNLRAEPNTSATIIATLRQGTSVTIIGTNDDETWFNVRLQDGREGWIRADLLNVVGPPTPTPSPTPEPQVEEFNGVPMVLVPAGCFVMGSDEAQLELAVTIGTPQNIADVEKPPEKICFDTPFWIDQYEVTNGQFDQFGGQASMPAVNDDAAKPREQISWYEAKAYCEMRGGRLPTEAEWEYAARGPASLIYPWGNEFEPDNVTFLDNSDKLAQPVGSHPGGVSWVGAYDMSGNVWEWTSTLFTPYPYDATDGREGEGEANRTIRGGSYQDLDEFLRTSARVFWIASVDTYPSIGFRCARDVNE